MKKGSVIRFVPQPNPSSAGMQFAHRSESEGSGRTHFI